MAGHKRKAPKRPVGYVGPAYDFSAEVGVELRRLARSYPYPMFGALDDLRRELVLLARDIRLVRKGES